MKEMKTFKECVFSSPNYKDLIPDVGMQLQFRGKMLHLKWLLTNPELDREYVDAEWHTMRRLTWGYNTYNSQRKLDSKLCTLACYDYIREGKSSKLVKDHFFGVTLASEEVRGAFEKCNFDIDYMVNEWLPQNFYLFLKWTVTPEEHKKENISRAEHTREEKNNFKHIKNCSEVMYRKSKKDLTIN
jgi:hypothetical protein